MLDEKINQALEKFQSSTNNAIPEKEFYTRDEVAKLLNISFGTLHNWKKKEYLSLSKSAIEFIILKLKFFQN
jgi:DNA-binding transcriptional regulator YiaG